MGYTLRIGNAVINEIKHSEELPLLVKVECTTVDNAPIFPGCSALGTWNSRYPSNSDWDGFLAKTNTQNVLGKFTKKHPNCQLITKKDVDALSSARQLYEKTTALPPGWSEDGTTYDYDLARLLWFEFWMRWAVENCETPAFEIY